MEDPLLKFYSEYDWFGRKPNLKKIGKQNNNKKESHMPCGKRKGGKK